MTVAKRASALVLSRGFLLLGLLGGPILTMAPPAGAAPSGSASTSASPFSVAVDQDPTTGWRIITLGHDHPGDPRLSLRARIAPEAGANLFSFQVGGDELLFQPEKLGDLAQQRTGMPILFPTPNRVRDARMTFEGRSFQFEANNQKNFIHGLARRRPFTAEAPRASAREASVTLTLDWDERQPDWSRFPIKHQLAVTYAVRAAGLKVAYQIRNRDQQRLPYGFGLHPYFRLPGGPESRKDVVLTVPLSQRMEAVEMLPTGKLLPVAGTPYDLRRPTALDGRTFDDVYFGMTPSKRARFELRSSGLQLTLAASREFTHLVVFAPADRPLFSLENQTSSTDAHNLWAQGRKRESNLLMLAPGATGGGWVSWSLRRTKVKDAPRFRVKIENDCPRELDARFVVVRPGVSDADEQQAIDSAPVVKLAGRSRTERQMVPFERLVIAWTDGQMSAGFDSPADGEGGTIRIDPSCHGISETKGPGAGGK